MTRGSFAVALTLVLAGCSTAVNTPDRTVYLKPDLVPRQLDADQLACKRAAESERQADIDTSSAIGGFFRGTFTKRFSARRVLAFEQCMLRAGYERVGAPESLRVITANHETRSELRNEIYGFNHFLNFGVVAGGQADDLLAWHFVNKTKDAQLLQAYLHQFPAGAAQLEARGQLGALGVEPLSADEEPGFDLLVRLGAKRDEGPSAAARREAELKAIINRGGAISQEEMAALQAQRAALEQRRLSMKRAWDIANGSNNPDLLATFVKKFPKGREADLARDQLKWLSERGVTAINPPADDPRARHAKPAVPAVSEAAPSVRETLIWSWANGSNREDYLTSYITAYPDGRFAAEALRQLDSAKR